MIKVKTYTPKELSVGPKGIVLMEDVVSYWGQEGCKFNYELYLKIIHAKVFAK